MNKQIISTSRFRAVSRTNALLFLILSISFSTSAHANLLTNPSFESIDASASPFYIRSFSSTPGWTQFGDGVDLIHNSYTQPPPIPVLLDASEGVQFLDMNQAGSLGGIFQVVPASPGSTYRLELDTAAWAQNAIGGTIGYELYDPISSTSLAQGSFTDNIGGAWASRSLDAVATGTQIGVRIQGLVATQAGMGLDNVRLNAIAAAPEPSPIVLLSMGLGIAGSLLRRRL